MSRKSANSRWLFRKNYPGFWICAKH